MASLSLSPACIFQWARGTSFTIAKIVLIAPKPLDTLACIVCLRSPLLSIISPYMIPATSSPYTSDVHCTHHISTTQGHQAEAASLHFLSVSIKPTMHITFASRVEYKFSISRQSFYYKVAGSIISFQTVSLSQSKQSVLVMLL